MPWLKSPIAGVAQLVERQLPKLNVEGSSPFARFDTRLKQPCFVFCAPPLARAQKAIKMLELDELLEFESHGHSKIQSSE